MSDIIVPETNEEEIEIKYKATEKDEEEFFLMYHFNWPPSEVKNLGDDYRQWLIARLVAQRNMEKEAFVQQQMMQQIGGNIKIET